MVGDDLDDASAAHAAETVASVLALVLDDDLRMAAIAPAHDDGDVILPRGFVQPPSPRSAAWRCSVGGDALFPREQQRSSNCCATPTPPSWRQLQRFDARRSPPPSLQSPAPSPVQTSPTAHLLTPRMVAATGGKSYAAAAAKTGRLPSPLSLTPQ